MRRFSSSSSFTLIEILVVVTIISVLAALMLPATQKVKQRADSTKCVSNLRQIGMAINMYGEDNRVYPWALDNPTTSWSYTVNSVLGNTNGNSYAPGPNSRSKIIECPSRTYKSATTVPCYALHWRIFGDSAIPGYFVPTTFPRAYPFLQRPGEIILAGDVDQDATGNGGEAWAALFHLDILNDYDEATANTVLAPGDNSDATPGDIRWRHNGNSAANFLFVDGHVATIAIDALQQRHLRITGP